MRLPFGLLLTFCAVSRAGDLIPLFPETTVASASLRHAEKWAAFPEHPIATAVEAKGLKELFIQTAEHLTGSDGLKHFEKESGISMADLRGKFSGEMTLALTSLELAKDKPSGPPEFELAAAVEFSGDAAVVSSVLKALASEPPPPASPDGEDQDSEEDEEGEKTPSTFAKLIETKAEIKEHAGVEIHIHAPDALKDAAVEALAWCVREGVLMLATGEEPLRDMIDRAAGKGDGKSFADSSTWKTATAESGDADFLLTANLAELVKSMFAGIEAEESAKPKGRGTGRSSEPSPLELLKGVELDAFDVLSLGLTIEKESIYQSASATYTRMPGIIKALQASGDVSPPDFLPGNTEGASWSQMDTGAVVQEILKLLTTMSGGSNPLEMMAKAAGFDLKVLDQFGAGYFQVTRQFGEITFEDILAAPEMPNTVDIVVPAKEGAVIGLRLKEPKVVDNALRGLLKKRPLFKLDAREYMDFKLHMTSPAPAKAKESSGDEEEDEDYEEPEPPQWAITVAGDWLLVSVGRIELLESILAGMRKTPDQPLWKRPDVQKAMESLPAGGTYRRYQDLEPTARVLITSLIGAAAVMPGLEFLEGADPEDYLKELRLPLRSIEKWHVESGAVRSTSRIQVSPKSE